MNNLGRILSVGALVVSLAPLAGAQKTGPQGQGQGPGQGGGQGSSANTASLQGVSWAHAFWDSELVLPKIEKRCVACYVLVYGNSAAQPFLLQPAPEGDPVFQQQCRTDGNGNIDETDPAAKSQCDLALKKSPGQIAFWSPCTKLDADHPILMGQNLVIAIDTSRTSMLDRVKILNLNITNQQGSPINPTPVRPSFANTGTGSLNLAGTYYLTWPNQIPGDTVVTVNVNAIYTPPIPGDPWSPATFYPAGSVITSSSGDGHYYTAVTGGISGTGAAPGFAGASTSQIRDGSVLWVDFGNTAPQGTGGGGGVGGGGGKPLALWSSNNTTYGAGQSIYDPYNGHYYMYVSATPAGAGTGRAPIDPFSLPTISDQGVVWVDQGPYLPLGAVANPWMANTAYAVGSWVGPLGGHYFQALVAGTSSPSPLVFPVAAAPAQVHDGSIQWRWQDAQGASRPVPAVWLATHLYSDGEWTLAQGHYLRAVRGGTSASAFSPNAVRIPDGSVQWVYLGVTAPAGGCGDTWAPSHAYAVGACTSTSEGKYFAVVVAGRSAAQFALPSVKDNELTWTDEGVTAPAGKALVKWQPNHHYEATDAIGPKNGHYFSPTAAGQSGAREFTTPVVRDGTVIWEPQGTGPGSAFERQPDALYRVGDWMWINPDAKSYFKAIRAGTSLPAPLGARTISDLGVLWQDEGTTPPVVKAWAVNSAYNKGDFVLTSNGHYYQASSPGVSGPVPTQPYFGITSANTQTVEAESAGNLPIVWEDSGTTPPSSVSSGQPQDQTVSLLNLPFSQSHSLSYYNLASGVVYSTVRSRSFGFTGSGSSETPVQTGSSATVDPVLLFTIYPIPIDAEKHCGFKCIWSVPGGSFGLSLSNPSTSFYVGASFEVLRNLQFFAGYNWSKQAHLPPAGTTQGMMATNSGTPTTVQKFDSGAAFGLTLNISGFIQSLFGGGGGGGGGSNKSGGSQSSATTPSSPSQ